MAPDNFAFPRPAIRQLLLCIFAFTIGAAHADCAGDIDGLRRIAQDVAFPLDWIETGMDDGRPLRLTLSQREETLHFQFNKTPAGLWAEGLGEICAVAGALEVQFGPGALHPGPDASWLLRRRLEGGARLRLARLPSGELQVSTFGWHSRFAAASLQRRPTEPPQQELVTLEPRHSRRP